MALKASDWLLSTALSATAGAVDVIGFLALGGLFTARITGNLVILTAHYVTGRFSQLGPLLAVPVFVVVLSIVILLFATKPSRRARRTLLILHTSLLIGFLALGACFGPFSDPDSAIAVFVAMIGVAAMAAQNAFVRLELPGFPSSAVMTTNITQLTIDLAMLFHGKRAPIGLAQSRRDARLTFLSVIGFVAGCAAGGFLELWFGLRALVLPVVLATIAIPLGEIECASVKKSNPAFTNQ
jgi:uncharacterized membrane protein YoaK (UPF0700 family)